MCHLPLFFFEGQKNTIDMIFPCLTDDYNYKYKRNIIYMKWTLSLQEKKINPKECPLLRKNTLVVLVLKIDQQILFEQKCSRQLNSKNKRLMKTLSRGFEWERKKLSLTLLLVRIFSIAPWKVIAVNTGLLVICENSILEKGYKQIMKRKTLGNKFFIVNLGKIWFHKFLVLSYCYFSISYFLRI